MRNSTRYLVNGNAAAVPLQDQSVHCIVTSPPYWSLRRYSDAQDRYWPAGEYSPMPGVPLIAVPEWTGPLGLEPTPELYIWHSVLWARECWRVLRDDGVMWVVIGDSYAADRGYQVTDSKWRDVGNNHSSTVPGGLQPGDLVGIPARLQLALQADGWIVRNDDIWHKLNPMPESINGRRWQRCRVKIEPGRPPAIQDHLPVDGQRPGGNRGNQWGDVQNQPNAVWEDCPGCPKCSDTGGYVLRRGSWRHTRAHEIVLMCVKGMGYWSDQEQVREGDHITVRKAGKDGGPSGQDGRRALGFEQSDTVTVGRNPRSVLSIASEPYKGAHYACFPTALIAPLIRATCPAKCCPVCGTGWSPVVEPSAEYAKLLGRDWADYDRDEDDGRGHFALLDGTKSGTRPTKRNAPGVTAAYNVQGYRPSCDCQPTLETGEIPLPYGPESDAGTWVPVPVPGRVFDPFLGSGTTLKVAHELGVDGVGLDLAHSYLDEQAKVRAAVGAPSGALKGLPLFALTMESR